MKVERFIETARAVALASPGVGGKKHNTFRVGAILVRKNKILAAGYNSYKTHPKLSRFFAYPHLHAESNCILSLGMNQCVNTRLYIVRVRRNGDLANSRPCKECQALIKFAGIIRVIYSTETSIAIL